MITRVEYESCDYRRTATVLFIAPKRWHLMVRVLDEFGRPIHAKESYRKSLTSAQGAARAWVSR